MKKVRNLFLLGLLVLSLYSCKQEKKQEPETVATEIRQWKPEDTRSLSGVTAKRGLIHNSEKSTPGYLLYEPSNSTYTYLLNKKGELVHVWNADLNSMNSYLQPNGHLIRLERDEDFPTFAAGGQAGRIREYDWDGTILWNFKYYSETELIHHDIEVMPNGNILAISYDALTPKEAIAMGKDPQHIPKAGIWLDKIIEIQPTKPEGGKVVWKWHMKDHLVQDLDDTKANYGLLSENPRKINLNISSGEAGPPMTQEQVDHMKQMGMMTSNATVDNRGSDLTHTNAISYNPDLDQIVISVPGFSEILVIDHSTSMAEAKGSTGGKAGHGGDLLYRWGNSVNYGWGTEENQQLFGQHDVKWIPKGYPGEGKLMVFNNDIRNPESKLPNMWAALGGADSPEINVTIGDVGNYSAIYEWAIPKDSEGNYSMTEGGAFGPEEPDWSYTAPDKYSFYSAFISGAHRLKNGHTLITQGMQGRFFEIDANGEVVWEYWNPYKYDYKLPDGSPAQPGGPFIYGVFRGTLYPADFEAFNGKELVPVTPQPAPSIFKMPPPPTQASASIQ
ncbi:aryl-sulfate sulfotransferase [Cyclobacterium sp.]|uniref:aryl-sulfate sulfotransferase n=1 Tax=Cyclobacterium sp. TaxID=1966343 RepID=UPI0019ADEFCC|nr:aryl-sulfate sulfotransferase [Cyclobacterium sp.]MBD3630838.1 aryl-sulfate sulfotransferase [Cyclobacterium sp.]